MNPLIILKIGGTYCLALGIFHLMFWKIFHWDTQLAKLSHINRAVMQLLNICLTFLIFVISYISFAHTSELLTSALGKSLLVYIALLWFMRALGQIYFFGSKNKISLGFFVFFLLGAVLYSMPLIL